MGYDDGQDDKMQKAILLDLIGRYRISLAMSWSGGDLGYGVAVHLPRNWAIGVTPNRDDIRQRPDDLRI